jgi:hypothetical protein
VLYYAVVVVVVVVGAWSRGNILPITGDIRDPHRTFFWSGNYAPPTTTTTTATNADHFIFLSGKVLWSRISPVIGRNICL